MNGTGQNLGERRLQLLEDLHRLWLRASDLRFGQLLRAACDPQPRDVREVTEESLRAGVSARLAEWPDRPPPPGPYWDTKAPGQGSFLNGHPRDPARIQWVLQSFVWAWGADPTLHPGEVLGRALEAAGWVENDFGTRWLTVEDGGIAESLNLYSANRRRRDHLATMRLQRPLTREDLLDAWLEAERYRTSHPDFADYYYRRAWAMENAFVPTGPPIHYARRSHEHQLLWSRFMWTVRGYNDLHPPWGVTISGVPAAEDVDVKERYGPPIQEAIDRLKRTYRVLLLELMERIWGIGPDRTVAREELPHHGFDPDKPPPDKNLYW